MTTENSNLPAARPATLALTQTMLSEPKTLMEMVQLPAIQNRWVKTYESVSGKQDGDQRFAAEMILFNQAAKKLDKCDRFSVYAAFIELAISGLTLRDGLTYIVGYGKTAQFMVGWKGRLEQMMEIPKIIHVSEPQLVYSCDEFDFEKGMKTVIHSHRPAFPRPDDAIIIYVYMPVHFKHGKEVFIMDRDDVLNIRDKYSMSYKAYMKALDAPINKDKKIGDTLKGVGNGYEYDIEAPMWISSEGQAFKKTLVKRTWNSMEKLPKQSALDERYNEFLRNNPDVVYKAEVEEDDNQYADQANAVKSALGDLTILDNGDTVDTNTGEITASEDVTKKTRATRTTKPKEDVPPADSTPTPEAAANTEQELFKPEPGAAVEQASESTEDLNLDEGWN